MKNDGRTTGLITCFQLKLERGCRIYTPSFSCCRCSNQRTAGDFCVGIPSLWHLSGKAGPLDCVHFRPLARGRRWAMGSRVVGGAEGTTRPEHQYLPRPPKIFTEFFGKCKIFHKKIQKKVQSPIWAGGDNQTRASISPQTTLSYSSSILHTLISSLHFKGYWRTHIKVDNTYFYRSFQTCNGYMKI